MREHMWWLATRYRSREPNFLRQVFVFFRPFDVLLAGKDGVLNKQVDVTAAWQTITINFNEFDSPTWGDTMSLPAIATGKFQAIDWGISDTATSFEVFIDDIELI